VTESTPPLDDFALADEFALARADTPLLPIILDAIALAGGRITFAAFMALTLGHPEHGYYSRQDLRWGKDGDYETSPEVHPIFGYLWARQILECWERLDRPASFDLVEVGAGSGAFMASILTWLRTRAPECFAAARAVVLDGHPHRLEQQRATLASGGFAAEHALIEDWLSREGTTTGIVISNVFFDALPIHLIERSGDDLHEVYVATEGGRLALQTGHLSTSEVSAYFETLGLRPGDGARAEVSLAAREAMRRIAARIGRGYIITIDYGYEARELYASWRTQGTLMAFRAHSPQPDILGQPGLTDLTYHVDFTTLAAAAAAEGFAAAPLTSQAEALTVLGLPDALRAAGERGHLDVQRYAAERRAAETLTDMSGLGRIKVLAMAKDAPLDGLRCLRPLESLMRQ
jgi:SAM-dependent MidA family methyltransferase